MGLFHLPGRCQKQGSLASFYTVVCGVLMVWALAVPSAKADFSDGIKAYSAGDYKTAMDEWLPYAAENDSRALYNLGQMFRLGQGVSKNMGIAEQYYLRAARQGHPGARGNLGSIYYSSNPPRVDEALYYWRSAARGGDARAQYLLGAQYFNGENVNRDHVLAYAWITLAAEAGLEDAQDSLAVLAQYVDEDDIAEGVRLSKTFGKSGSSLADPETTIQVPPETKLVEVAPLVVAPVKSVPVSEPPTGVIQAESTTVVTVAPVTVSPMIDEPVMEPIVAVDPLATAEMDVADLFRVQIAALRSEASAADYWQRASGNRPELMAGIVHYVVRADLGEKGIYYRLQLGHFADRGSALAFCDQLKASKLSCYVVATP